MVDWSVVKMKGVEIGMKIVALGRKRAQMQIWLWLDLHAKIGRLPHVHGVVMVMSSSAVI